MAERTPSTPRCTYRLQLTPTFGFREAAEIAPYLESLGVSHAYCSSYLRAAPGSTHGYDVLDHQSLNPELGGTIGHEQFCMTLGKHHLGQVLDLVPNHMSIAHSDNRWWWDVLENGPSSRYASYFDVDWEPQEKSLHNRVLMPILGDHYGRAIEEGQLQIQREGGSFHVKYFDHLLPLAPRTIDTILSAAAERTDSDVLAFAADVAGHLPPADRIDRRSVNRRHRDKEILRKMLDHEFREHSEWGTTVDELIADINRSPDDLDTLLERQNYRLAFWKLAKQDLDYRRFFDINTLVGLRMEDDRVFADTHALVLHWLKHGVLDGLRIDHPDGLRDPRRYFERLKSASPEGWIVAEKILMADERLPENWPIDGTTGYDFLNRVLRLFIDPQGEAPLTEFYAEFTGEPTDYAALEREKKHLVIRDLFASDLNRLTAQLAEISEGRRRFRDYSRREMNQMLREALANLDVYRTYVQAEDGQISAVDKQRINSAIDAAKANRPDLDADLFDLFRKILLLETHGVAETELVMRFQQSSGPVMAKGVEDTLFYCYNRFIALNEVGSELDLFSLSVPEFHRRNREMLEHYPRTMLATTTHDTKRGEDMRMRLVLLSEIPQRFSAAVRSWSAANDQHRSQFRPDRNAEYLYYQTLVGAWPIEPARLQAYMLKAVREAKQHTSWTAPNEEYEQAVALFIEKTMADRQFCDAIGKFVAELVGPGRINSLSQCLLKLASPGVPDIYQGSELWDFRLVDPDNRGPVDFAIRSKLLQEWTDATPETILARADEGLPKLWLIQQLLRYRRSEPDVFNLGAYEPLSATGGKAQNVISFMRSDRFICAVPRLLMNLGGDWKDTSLELPTGRWRHLLTGEILSGGSVPIADLFKRFPVAALARKD
jgi:(1->4)-alpha-D-glucan 1-alpha-D-glucosylmutase